MLDSRKQPRIRRRFLAEIFSVHDPHEAELVSVENVSFSGARLTSRRYWNPGMHVNVKSASVESLRLVLLPTVLARVVYCLSVGTNRFAIGLDFLSKRPTDGWWPLTP